MHHDRYLIDVKLTIDPHDKAAGVRPRLFFPAVIANDIAGLKAVFYSDKKSIEKKSIKDLVQFGKEQPSFFGLEDHYFLNAGLIKIASSLPRELYFKVEGDAVQGILQAPTVRETTTWDC